MTKKNIHLSICIPTFNRGPALRSVLESIVSQDVFIETNEVEIVVSDNASTDDTPAVVAEFVNRFPGKIVFYRQESNVWSANFHQALALGRGEYRKLHNDTLLIRPGALRPLVNTIRELAGIRPVIFMTNGNRVKDGDTLFEDCRTLDAFIQQISFFSTWIGGFGLWREEIDEAQAFRSDTNHLIQTEIVCKQMAAGRQAVAFFGNYFISKQDFRSTYNWAEVFGKNYLAVLKPYLASGHLSRAVYEQAKQEVLLRHILPNYFKTTNVYDKTRFFENLADYRDDAYFYEAIEKHLPLLWRFNNPHNHTVLHSATSAELLARVRVGIGTLGGINVMGSCRQTTRLEIGRFVSLADGVGFVLGEGSPRGDSFSNYGAESVATDAAASADGSIIVAPDVWIGRGALILSGVTIGRGSIIEAGSVVFEDVPPYSRVRGNPAQVYGSRFEPEVVRKLCAFDYSTVTPQAIANLGEAFRAPLDKDNVDDFLRHMAEGGKAPETVPVSTEKAQRVPAVLILDVVGNIQGVEQRLATLAEGSHRGLPVVVLTTHAGSVPEWSDSLRYLQASTDEYAEVVQQLRMLQDFEWAEVIEIAA